MTEPKDKKPAFTVDGQEFVLRVTVPRARRIKERLNVDLLDVATQGAENPFVAMADNPELFGDVLWELCEERAAGLGWDQDKFLDGFDGPTIDAAADALITATIAAFPKKKRVVLEAIQNAQEDALDRVTEKLTGGLIADVVNAEVDAAVEKAIQTRGSSSTS